jgi:hypothetical protein
MTKSNPYNMTSKNAQQLSIALRKELRAKMYVLFGGQGLLRPYLHVTSELKK